MVMMRSPGSIMRESALSSVVLPEPVPPEMMMFSRQRATISRKLASCGETRAARRRSLAKSSMLCENLRIERHGPFRLSGGMITLTRLPSARRASSIGLDFVDAPPDRRRDALSDVQHLRVAAELKFRQLQLAAPLDIDHSRRR